MSKEPKKFGKQSDGTFIIDDTFPNMPEYWERRGEPVPLGWQPFVKKEIARRKREK